VGNRRLAAVQFTKKSITATWPKLNSGTDTHCTQGGPAQD